MNKLLKYKNYGETHAAVTIGDITVKELFEWTELHRQVLTSGDRALIDREKKLKDAANGAYSEYEDLAHEYIAAYVSGDAGKQREIKSNLDACLDDWAKKTKLAEENKFTHPWERICP